MAVRTQLISPGGMVTTRRYTTFAVLLLVWGMCCLLFTGCLKSLRTSPNAYAKWNKTIVSSDQQKSRFKDTQVVTLAYYVPHPTRTTASTRGNPTLDSAVNQCVQHSMPGAIRTLLSIVESHTEQDSIYWEALFQLGECWALAGEYDRACRILSEIAYRNEGVPPDIHQRALVRLGHVHCIHGERRMAVQLFERFQALYPFSPYRPLADCQSVRFRGAGK